jgi:hypothetical protein
VGKVGPKNLPFLFACAAEFLVDAAGEGLYIADLERRGFYEVQAVDPQENGDRARGFQESALADLAQLSLALDQGGEDVVDVYAFEEVCLASLAETSLEDELLEVRDPLFGQMAGGCKGGNGAVEVNVHSLDEHQDEVLVVA